MSEGGGDAGGATGSSGGAPDMSTTYNGTVPCQGCGSNLGPATALFAGAAKRCRKCRKQEHHRHVKGRMSK